MTKYFHIVQVHPVELGQPNLSKVTLEREFDTKDKAEEWANAYNHRSAERSKAVYHGRVNDETGELE